MENSPGAGTMPSLYERDPGRCESRRGEPPRIRVDGEPALPHESQEGHVELPCKVHGERGGRANRGEDRDPRHDGLLHDLEPAAAAHLEDGPRERDLPLEELIADDLVHRVVAAHVL